MKKSELIQLTQVIEHLVAREVRKQLPQLIGEAFQNMMGKSVVSERQKHVQQSISEVVEQIEPAMVADPDDFKMSMRELFAGAIPTGVRMPIHEEGSIAPQQPKHYTKDPKINAILNETVSDLRQRERMVGGAAFMGGYSPSIEMASAAMPGTVGAGEMMNEGEVPAFARNMPSMPNMSPGVPLSRPPQAMSESHIPGEMIPEGISALDVARQVPLSQPVAKALTKNYSAMMKLIDNKRKKI
jgi:hypothetical protein